MPIYLYTQIWIFPYVSILSWIASYIWEGKQPYFFTLLVVLYYRRFTTFKHKFLSLALSLYFSLYCSAVYEKESVWFFGTKLFLGYLQKQCFYSTARPYRAIKLHTYTCVCVCTSGLGGVGGMLSSEIASNSKNISYRLNIQGIFPNQSLQF